ncbi:uncharacterized protein TNCV_4836681 [Trichonephila clavipes]|nr:uncharacterized protein TNCV_4836681 [Trichonephila clavipes]
MMDFLNVILDVVNYVLKPHKTGSRPQYEHNTIPCQNCGGGDRWCRHLSSLQGILPSFFVLSPVWGPRPRPTTCILLAPCHDEFRGPCSDYVRQLTTSTPQGEPQHLKKLMPPGKVYPPLVTITADERTEL